MALINSAFSVNVTPSAMPPIVHVSEYDIGRTYTVTINGENGSAFNIPTGTTATVEGTLNGAIGFTTDATISGSTVSFALTESMTARSGKAWCKIKLTLNDEPIQTCAFVLAVDRAGVEADTVIGAPGFEEQIVDAVQDWLDEHPPASGGMTEEFKQALLDCFENVAWINDDGQTYYDALYAALDPQKTLVSISAVFTQGSAVIYDTDSLNTLKQYLTVTATYDDTSTGAVTNYTLSGTLTEGTSTITVLYSGKTTTFNVTVTEDVGTVNYVVVGNPVINGTWLYPAQSNGGFIKTPEAFSPGSSAWKIQTEIIWNAYPAGTKNQDVVCSVDGSNQPVRSFLWQTNQKRFLTYLSSNRNSWDLMAGSGSDAFDMSTGTTYLLEASYANGTYTLRASTDDGVTWPLTWSKAVNGNILGGNALAFGMIRNALAFDGQINLAKTKIYIDNTLWWSAIRG